MHNKFSLSFGISFIIVGALNIFFETDNTVLFALSISAVLFSIINIITTKYKLEFLYIIPFVVLVAILCYNSCFSRNNLFVNIVNSKITNILTFISFGSLFISEYIKTYVERKKERITNIMINNEIFNYSTLILKLINDYLEVLISKKIILDEEHKEFLSKIETLCREKGKQANITHDLLKMKKDHFSIHDFSEIYEKNNDVINLEKQLKEIEQKKN